MKLGSVRTVERKERGVPIVVRILIERTSAAHAGDGIQEALFDLRVTNRGRSTSPLAVGPDRKSYEVEVWGPRQTVEHCLWIHHQRSDGAVKLAERALRAFADIIQPQGELNPPASVWLKNGINNWRAHEGGLGELDELIAEGLNMDRETFR